MLGSFSDHGRGIINDVADSCQIFDGHFWWQAQYLVKFGNIAGTQDVCFSIQNAREKCEKKTRLCGGLQTDGFMLGSWSGHCTGRFKFLSNFAWSFLVASTIFGDVAG